MPKKTGRAHPLLIITAEKIKKARLIKETGLPAVPLSLTPALSKSPLDADNGGCRAELTPRPLLRRTACSPAPALSPMQAVLFAAGSCGPPVSTLNISDLQPLYIHYILCTVFLQQKYCFRTLKRRCTRTRYTPDACTPASALLPRLHCGYHIHGGYPSAHKGIHRQREKHRYKRR